MNLTFEIPLPTMSFSIKYSDCQSKGQNPIFHLVFYYLNPVIIGVQSRQIGISKN